jgi:hypothetical protein
MCLLFRGSLVSALPPAINGGDGRDEAVTTIGPVPRVYYSLTMLSLAAAFHTDNGMTEGSCGAVPEQSTILYRLL